MLDLNKHLIKVRPALSAIACLLVFVELRSSGEFLILHFFWQCQQILQTNLQYFLSFLFSPSQLLFSETLAYFLSLNFPFSLYNLQSPSDLSLLAHYSLILSPCFSFPVSLSPDHLKLTHKQGYIPSSLSLENALKH